MASDYRKQLGALRKRLRRCGWDVSPTGRGHVKFTNPKGDSAIAPSTGSDWRAILNLKADLKRLGANLTPGRHPRQDGVS